MTTPTLVGLPEGTIPGEPVTRIRVLTGEDDDGTRRGTKTVIARSESRYYCPDAATVARCIEALRDSDERLRSRPEELMLWDWESTYLEPELDNPAGGGTVLLGVAWYDPSSTRTGARHGSARCTSAPMPRSGWPSKTSPSPTGSSTRSADPGPAAGTARGTRQGLSRLMRRPSRRASPAGFSGRNRHGGGRQPGRYGEPGHRSGHREHAGGGEPR